MRFIGFMNLKLIVHLDQISEVYVIEIGRCDCSHDLNFVSWILFFGHHGLRSG